MNTKEQLKKALMDIGIKEGDDLMVHSSFKSLGGIEGGAKAVIEAFSEVLGKDGTLLMPAFTFNSVTRENPVFDYEKSPNCVGYLGEFLRCEVEGSIRSIHATHSVCALGKRAFKYTSGHENDITPVGENSPIIKLCKNGGKILMLGCSPNHLTVMHGVEETAEPDYLLDRENPIEYTLVLKDKTVTQTAIRHLFEKDGFYFAQLYSRIINLLDESEYTEKNVLSAPSFLFDAKAILEKGSEKLKEEPYYFVEKRKIQ